MSHILLIEPDALLKRTYQMALEGDGYSVSTACDAQWAIDSADTKRPDMVVLELQLAMHNGIEFLYEFRSYTEWQSVPVIIQSLTPPGEFRAVPGLWSDLGVVAYLYKPRTTLALLLDSVSQYLNVAKVT